MALKSLCKIGASLCLPQPSAHKQHPESCCTVHCTPDVRLCAHACHRSSNTLWPVAACGDKLSLLAAMAPLWFLVLFSMEFKSPLACQKTPQPHKSLCHRSCCFPLTILQHLNQNFGKEIQFGLRLPGRQVVCG